MSKYEKHWAIRYPFAAISVKKISKKCDSIYKSVLQSGKLDTYENGGLVDAYRHVFYMAAFTQKINAKKIRQLGEAHELANFEQFLKQENEFGVLADSISGVMDLKNNDTGISIGVQNSTLELAALSKLVMTEIQNGKALILKRNKQGNLISCDGVILNLNEYKGKWNVPKCLIASGSNTSN